MIVGFIRGPFGWGIMKLLGHHVAVPSVLLALVDASLFLTALYLFGLTGTCQSCVLHSVTHLRFYEAILLTAAFIVLTASIGLYNRDAFLDFRVFIRRFLLATQLVFLPTVTFVGLGDAMAGLPFGWYVGILSIAIAVFFLVMFLFRVILIWVIDPAFLKRRVLVVGDGEQAGAVEQFIVKHGTSHLRCVGRLRNVYFTPSEARINYGSVAVSAEPKTQSIPLLDAARALKAEEIVIAVNDRRGLPMWQVLECKLQGLLITDYLHFWERETGKLDLQWVGPGWLALNEGFRLDWSRRWIKRTLDVVVSIAFLVAALPVSLFVSLCIALDSRGPVFYKQERVGLNGKIFWIWKFRSMRADAEKDGRARFASINDDRVTRVGRIIRKLRIDEFPQVFNVLKGDMSFIGPRPERPQFVEQLRKQIPLYDLRHRMQPGITGWAQVNYPYGDCVEDAKFKLAYDLYYVKNQDSVLDLFILLQTVRVLLFSHGSR